MVLVPSLPLSWRDLWVYCWAFLFIFSHIFLFPSFFLKKDLVYLFFRQKGRERGREGEKHQCVVASSRTPYGRPGLQPRHVPWLGIKPATLCFAVWHSIHWATSARASPAPSHRPHLKSQLILNHCHYLLQPSHLQSDYFELHCLPWNWSNLTKDGSDYNLHCWDLSTGSRWLQSC